MFRSFCNNSIFKVRMRKPFLVSHILIVAKRQNDPFVFNVVIVIFIIVTRNRIDVIVKIIWYKIININNNI